MPEKQAYWQNKSKILKGKEKISKTKANACPQAIYLAQPVTEQIQL